MDLWEFDVSTSARELDPVPEPSPDDIAELVTNQALAREIARGDQLAEAVVSNRKIGVAVGLVMAQLNLSEPDAFETLRRHSMNTNRRLADLATDVIYLRKLNLESPPRVPRPPK